MRRRKKPVQIKLEWEEIEMLLREGLSRKGIEVPTDAVMLRRDNNKNHTIRVVFETGKKERKA